MRPLLLHFAGAVLKVEDGVAAGGVLVVARGRVDEHAAGGAGDVGLEPVFTDIAVGNVLDGIEIFTQGGGFDGGLPAIGIEHVRAGLGHGDAIHIDRH